MKLSLPSSAPMAAQASLDFLGAHTVAGLEQYRDGVFSRVVTAPHGAAVVSLRASGGEIEGEVEHHDPRDEPAIEARLRHLLDLDADPLVIDDRLSADPALAPLVAARPGLRAPGTVDEFESAVRTIVGQQNSVSSSRPVLARIVAGHGVRLDDTWTLFPTPSALAAADAETLPVPRARGRAIVGLARAVVEGSVTFGPDVDRAELRASLLALRGIGPWTADYLSMRTTADPDVLLTSDLVVRRAAADLGIDLSDGRPAWSPFRSYATYHLWAHLYADVWSSAR